MVLALKVLPRINEGEAPRLAIADQPSLSKPVIPCDVEYTIRARCWQIFACQPISVLL